MQMRWAYTADTTELATWAICRVTGGKYSHCLPVFYGGGEPLYFESRVSKDKYTGKNGVRGPYKFSKVLDWHERNPNKHRLMLQPDVGYLPFTDTEVDAAYDTLAAAVHTVKYPCRQILQNWLAQRTGLHLHYKRGSVEAWDCSETCMVVVPSRWWWCYDMLRLRADDIAPSGHKLTSLESGTERVLAATNAPQATSQYPQIHSRPSSAFSNTTCDRG